MAQTTNALSWANCKIELSANGSAWTDVSGFANSVSVDGGERAISEFFTSDGNTPILTAGKRSSLEVTVKAVYTEAGSDPYAMAIAAYEGNTALYVRWSPKGGLSTNFQFTTALGHVLKPVYPTGAADSADAIAIEVAIKTATITKSAVT